MKNKIGKIRRHYVLFNPDLPFRSKVEKDSTKYNRKTKHKKSNQDS